MASKDFPTYERKETHHQLTGVPDFTSAFKDVAESTNVLGAIGANVAQVASNKIAADLGAESGKNPKGDLGPSFTEFDKNFANSYKTQAHATLSLQAMKLITDSNIAVSKASRVTPELIQKSQDNINQGLQKIYALAPTEIRPQMEYTFTAAQNTQREQLNRRLLNEQHEDRRQNTLLYNDKNAETAHALAASGRFKEAEQLIKSNESINKSAVEGNVGFSVNQAKAGNDTVRQSVTAGKLQYGYDQASKEGKEDTYLKSLAKRPDWISDADYPHAIQSIQAYANNQRSLKSNYEQLVTSEFQAKIATNASAITGTELQAAMDKLSPVNAAKLNLSYINGIKSQMKDSAEQSDLVNNWQDPTSQANASDKAKNSVFNSKTDYAMKNSPGLSREAAESQVAASAGGTIPVFTKTLKNKLWGGDAQQMVSVAKQISDLQENGHGHALQGLNEQDKALASDIKHNFNPQDPASAARMITENKQNQDPNVRKDSETAFSNYMFDNTRKSGVTDDDFVLNTFGMASHWYSSGGFDTPWAKSSYASDIKSNWRNNFINTGRDQMRAKELTQEYINNNYGKTQVNGSSEWTLHPIEKAVGFPEGQGLEFINRDIMRQVSEPMQKLKQAYDERHSDTYWSIEGINSESRHTNVGKTHPFEKESGRLKFVKHTRNGVSTDTESYPLRLVGNNFNWELNVETAHGPRSIFLEAPAIGVHTYTPDQKWIQDEAAGRAHGRIYNPEKLAGLALGQEESNG